MDIRQQFIKTNQALDDIVMQVRPDQFDTVMPSYASYSDGQTLRQHINFCAHENACVPGMLAGEHFPPNAENTVDYLKDDFKTNYAALTRLANEAVLASSDEVLDATVHMSYGDAAARAYLNDITIQRSMAAIDIAQAAGIRDVGQLLLAVTGPGPHAELGRRLADVGPLLVRGLAHGQGIDLQADYVGFKVPDRFVVGYGLDYGNRFRELPFIGTVAGL